ncbi:MAG: hypothetical protein JST57_08125 [Bacteroidetes bacterium]|nr:hypothetical protein [Bacteroidota bacterium]MBS1925955.1 hypothetical protein [Bacteroidota bacterium]MCC6692911.1 hypothetical protein [Chitinophagaceae bacterium]
MNQDKEISALFRLIDDPDEYVYGTVSEKILSFGKDIIPQLEQLWEKIVDEQTQERIEMLIHRVHFRDLTQEFNKWKDDDGSLINGALIVARYNYPDMQSVTLLQEIEKIRRNTWLELNSYLTSIEKINVVNSILYNYYKLKGSELSYDNPDLFLLNKVIESKKGNAIGNGIFYLILCELLDIPVKAIQIPRQFILAYFDSTSDPYTFKSQGTEHIKFFIDAVNGQMYSHKDIENYFNKLSVHPAVSYFKPMNNKKIVQYLLEELAKCFDNERNHYKMEELLSLSALLDH